MSYPSPEYALINTLYSAIYKLVLNNNVPIPNVKPEIAPPIKLKIKITAKAGNNGKLFGSVTSKEVAAEIAKQYAVKVDKRKISMDDIKTFGSYKIEVKLYTNIIAEMTVMVGE